MTAYTPAFDFDPKETQMTFEEILSIVQDHTRTPQQKAADIHAALQSARIDSQKPVHARKVRRATVTRGKAQTPASESLNGFAGHSENTETAGENAG